MVRLQIRRIGSDEGSLPQEKARISLVMQFGQSLPNNQESSSLLQSGQLLTQYGPVPSNTISLRRIR